MNLYLLPSRPSIKSSTHGGGDTALFYAEGSMRAALLFFGLFIGNISTLNADEADVEPPPPSFTIKKSVAVEMLFGQYHNVIDLGTLPCGATGSVEVELRNPHNTDFDFEGIELGCKCTTANLKGEKLSTGDVSVLNIGLETPRTSGSLIRSNMVRLIEKGGDKNSVHLVLRYQLSGLLSFIGGSSVVDVDANLETQSIRIPFLVSAPVILKDVHVQIEPDRPGLLARFVEEDGKLQMHLKFETDSVPDEGLALNVIARHDELDLEDSFRILLLRRKEIEVTPRTMRLKISDDDLVATALLRHRVSVKTTKPDKTGITTAKESPAETISVDANVGDLKAGVKVRRIGSGIYRLRISFPKDKLFDQLESPDASKVLNWRIVTPEKSFSVESPLLTDSFVSVSESSK